MSHTEQEYVLGTHADEAARLLLQHRVWRPRALDAWRRAGFTRGMTILDVGCGPGHASVDLAEIVGPNGRVVAIDQSRRFLDALETTRVQRGLRIDVRQCDLTAEPIPVSGCDAAWTRWVFCFVRNPKDVLARVAAALRPGATYVIHEYFDYATWRLSPRSPELEEFVQFVMKSWRAMDGEPDVGRDIPGWLDELGFDVRAVNPIVDIVTPSNFVWEWPAAFVRVGAPRLVDLGHISRERCAEIIAAVDAAAESPSARMVTPGVAEIIAVKRPD